MKILKNMLSKIRYRKCGRCKGMGRTVHILSGYTPSRLEMKCSSCEGKGFIKIF